MVRFHAKNIPGFCDEGDKPDPAAGSETDPADRDVRYFGDAGSDLYRFPTVDRFEYFRPALTPNLQHQGCRHRHLRRRHAQYDDQIHRIERADRVFCPRNSTIVKVRDRRRVRGSIEDQTDIPAGRRSRERRTHSVFLKNFQRLTIRCRDCLRAYRTPKAGFGFRDHPRASSRDFARQNLA